MEGKIKFLFFLLHDLRILERKEMDGQLYIGEKYRRQNFDFSFQTLESFPGCIFPQVFAGKIKFLFFFFHDPFFCRFSRRVKGRKRVENFI